MGLLDYPASTGSSSLLPIDSVYVSIGTRISHVGLLDYPASTGSSSLLPIDSVYVSIGMHLHENDFEMDVNDS